MYRSERNIHSFFIQLILAALFILIGLIALLRPDLEHFFALDYPSSLLVLVTGIIEIVLGGFLFLSLLVPRTKRGIQAGVLFVLLYWFIRVLFTLVYTRISYSEEGRTLFSPNLFSWLETLFIDALVGVGLLAVIKRYGQRRR